MPSSNSRYSFVSAMVVLLAVVLVLGLISLRSGGLVPRNETEPESAAHSIEIEVSEPRPVPEAKVVPREREDETASGAAVVVEPVSGGKSGSSRRTVFRLVLDQGECRLDAIDEVTGDFRPVRALPALHAGMLACRLLAADGRLLGEQFVHAPDHVCVVLDPNAGGDEPEAVMLAGVGPQMFQVRFPADLSGETLEVHRITRTVPELSQTLLLTAPITP